MNKAHQSIGKVYARLTITEALPNAKSGSARVKAVCTCGVEKEYTLNNLESGRTKSCGCLRTVKAKALHLQNKKPPSWARIHKGGAFEYDGKVYRLVEIPLEELR